VIHLAPSVIIERACAMKKNIDGIRGRIAALEREALREEKGGNREKSRSLQRKIE